MKKGYAVLAALGGILIIFFVNLAGWSFYSLSQNIVSGFLEDRLGLYDENTQLAVIAVGFLVAAVLVAAVIGVSTKKILDDFMK